MSGQRTLVVWCRDWPVVAAGIPSEVPAAVVEAGVVAAATEAARTAGVAPGLRRRDAQARCPALRVVAPDPTRDAVAWEPVARALEALTPRLEVAAPGDCAFPAAGPARYAGGEEILAEQALALTGGTLPVGGSLGVGMADGRFAATVAARRSVAEGRPWIVPAGKTRAFLAVQPVSCLGRPELAGVLTRLGVATLGDFAALPPGAVTVRFGTDAANAHRLARGLDPQPLALSEPSPDLVAVVDLDPPVTQVEGAAFATRALAESFLTQLAERGVTAEAVVVEAETEHGEVRSRAWRHDGNLDAAAIAQRVRWQLEGWLAGPAALRPTGPLTILRLRPEGLAPARGHQLGLFDERAETEAVLRGLARVEAILGDGSVTVPVLQGGRGPADRVAHRTPDSLASPGQRPQDDRSPEGPWPGRVPPPAPALVSSEPIPAEVVDAGGAPVAVSGRGVLSSEPATVAVRGGPARPVAAWAGPWPADERWWDRAARRRRARFQVVLTDGAALLLALERGRFTVEATYD